MPDKLTLPILVDGVGDLIDIQAMGQHVEDLEIGALILVKSFMSALFDYPALI